MVLHKQRNDGAVPFPFLGGGIFSAPQHLWFTYWLMMCREGNKQQEQMTSETAKNLVSIASALIRMEEGRGKKGRKYKAEKCLEKMSSAVSASAAPKRHGGSLNMYLTLSSQVFSLP